MTGRERFMTALRRGTPDRVPMPFRMWKFLRKHYADTPGLEERAHRAHKEFGVGIWHCVAGAPMPCFHPTVTSWRDDVEVDVVHEVRGNRNYWERTIHTPEGDLHDVKQSLTVTEGSGDGPEIIEPLIKDLKRDLPLIRYMQADPGKMNIDGALAARERIGDIGLCPASIMSPIDCRDVMKQEDFLMLYYDDEVAFREIVDIGAEAMMRETECVMEAGFEVVQAWWFYASPSAGWSPRIYEKVFLPHVRRHVELVHSHDGIYVYYDDGKMGKFLDMYADSGIDALMTLAPPPMGDAIPQDVKSKYGGRICLMGGVDAVNEVYLSNPAAIRKMIRERLAVYKPGGGYILDGSNSIVYETPVENVRALADAGLEFGSY